MLLNAPYHFSRLPTKHPVAFVRACRVIVRCTCNKVYFKTFVTYLDLECMNSLETFKELITCYVHAELTHCGCDLV